jgi:hypothetical protein
MYFSSFMGEREFPTTFGCGGGGGGVWTTLLLVYYKSATLHESTRRYTNLFFI